MKKPFSGKIIATLPAPDGLAKVNEGAEFDPDNIEKVEFLVFIDETYGREGLPEGHTSGFSILPITMSDIIDGYFMPENADRVTIVSTKDVG